MGAPYPVVVVADEFAADGRLRAFLSGMTRKSVEVTRQRKERHTIHLWAEAPTETGTLPLFVKIYRPPVKRNLLTPILAARAHREYRGSRAAAQRGLNVLPAVAFGERRSRRVVVDQFVAFRQLERPKSVARLLQKAERDGEEARALRRRFAEELAALHRGGYLHLQASPRNLLRLSDGATASYVWIDHPSGMLFRRSVWATPLALADVLQVFRSRSLAPTKEERQRFLEEYAPDRVRFHGLAHRLTSRHLSPSTFRRLLKLGAFWKAC